MPLDTALPRCVLRGSLDPSTGMFYRTPERARIRTAQACDKCRIRKAKCSGDHPVCERCRVRGLACQYALERRTPWSRRNEAVLDRSTGQARPSNGTRSRSKGVSTTHGPSTRSTGVERPENSIGHTPRSRDRKDEIPSTLTLEGDQMEQSRSLDAPRAVEPSRAHHPVSHEALLQPYSEDPSAFLQASLMPNDFLAVSSDFAASGYREAVDDTQSMVSSPYSSYPYHAASCLDVPSDTTGGESAVCTPSTSASASPVLTRPNSIGPPTTPTNSYPGSPFALASYSPYLTSYASRPYVSSFLIEAGTNADHMGDHMTLNETKTSAADLSMFLDMDNVF